LSRRAATARGLVRSSMTFKRSRRERPAGRSVDHLSHVRDIAPTPQTRCGWCASSSALNNSDSPSMTSTTCCTCPRVGPTPATRPRRWPAPGWPICSSASTNSRACVTLACLIDTRDQPRAERDCPVLQDMPIIDRVARCPSPAVSKRIARQRAGGGGQVRSSACQPCAASHHSSHM
jgi:hypothetical protein